MKNPPQKTPQSSLDVDILGMSWTQFKRHMAENWELGQHFFICAPTGSGKTTFMVKLSEVRRRVLAFDLKAGDKTLMASGWDRITKFPLPYGERDKLNNDPTFRRIIGDLNKSPKARQISVTVMEKYFDWIIENGNFTVIIPDLAIFAAKYFGDMWNKIIYGLLTLRDNNVSLVLDAQMTSRIPPEAKSQASFIAIAYTLSNDEITEYASMMGIKPTILRGAVKAMKNYPFSWLIVSRNPRDPMIMTRPEV